MAAKGGGREETGDMTIPRASCDNIPIAGISIHMNRKEPMSPKIIEAFPLRDNIPPSGARSVFERPTVGILC